MLKFLVALGSRLQGFMIQSLGFLRVQGFRFGASG